MKNLPLLIAGVLVEMAGLLVLSLSFINHEGLNIPALVLVIIANALIATVMLASRRR